MFFVGDRPSIGAEELIKNNMLFSSFNVSCLHELLNLAPEWPRGLLLNNFNSDWLDCARSLNCYSVHPNFECMKNSTDINAVTNLGLYIIPYTVNDRSAAMHLLQLGAKFQKIVLIILMKKIFLCFWVPIFIMWFTQ